MTRKPPRRTARQEPEQTPVVLPHVLITITETGHLDVTVDGTDFPPPSKGEAWTRSTFGTLLDAITKDRTTTVRIEVHESDGTMFTDIIHSRRRTTPKTEPPHADSGKRRSKHAKTKHTQDAPGPVLVEVTADGFVPREDVAVAVIVSHTDTSHTGDVRALLDKHQLTSAWSEDTGEVVLFGRVSGTIHVRRLP